MPRSVLMLELNELAPPLMDRFIDEGILPNFARFRSQSTVAITDPEEAQSGLNPWIQWVTVHTGASREEHGIEKLGEASNLRLPTIGSVVGDAGRTAWLCGSMNLPARAAGGGLYLPDPWNPAEPPSPTDLEAFAGFVRANVQEHSNASVTLSPASVARFAWHQVRHGLSPATVRDAVGQLLSERRGRRGRWARASVLDRFQWDVFAWYWRRDKPAFGTFFSNSTAHYQHVYWRNFDPEVFDAKPADVEQRLYGDAVRHGYRQMDALVADAMALADETGSTLVLCTALSQQPFVQADASGGKFVYRPHDFGALVATLGLRDVDQIAPVMSEQFHLYFRDDAAAAAAATTLGDCTVEGDPAFATRVVGTDVFTGCSIHHLLAPHAVLRTPDGREHRFADLFYRSDTTKSGYHHPDGMWWVRTGHHRVIDQPVSLRAVAPTILDLLGLEAPPTMACPAVDVVGLDAPGSGPR
jgi:hypothetical protein